MVVNIKRKKDQRRFMSGTKRVRCFINGVDRSDHVFYADVRRRIVGLYLTDENGELYLTPDKQEVAQEFIRPRHVIIKILHG